MGKPRSAAQARRLAAAREAALAQLVPGLAHEIRGPLTTISGLSQVLARTPELPLDAREALALMPGQVERADALLRNLVAFARGPRAEEDLPLSLHEALGRALELTAYPLRASAIEIESELAPELPLVAADPEELLQVALAVLLAAIEATRASGTKGPIRIVTKALPGRVAELTVSLPVPGPSLTAGGLRAGVEMASLLGGRLEATAEPALVVRLPGWTDLPAPRPNRRRGK